MRWSNPLTGRGSFIMLLGGALCLAAWFAREASLLWPGGVLLSLPLVAWLFLAVARPRVSIVRTATPNESPAGSPVDLGFNLRGGRRHLLIAEDLLPASFGSGASFPLQPDASVHYTCTPTRRGRYRLDALRLHYGDALGLASHAATAHCSTEVLVTPRVVPLGETEPAASGRIGDESVPNLAFAGPDDVLVREYRPRDDVRRIHWPSTARTGTLMVRREEQARDPSAVVLLDTRAAAYGSDPRGDRFEWAVSLAASAGIALLAAGYVVKLIVTGEGAAAVFDHVAEQDRWLRQFVEVSSAPSASLASAAQALDEGAPGHVAIAVLGRLTDAEASDLCRVAPRGRQLGVLHLPSPDAHGEALASARLTQAGWQVAVVGVEADPSPAWASLMAAS